MATPSRQPTRPTPGQPTPGRGPVPPPRSRRRGQPAAEPAPSGARAFAVRAWQLLVLAVVMVVISLALSGIFFGLVGLALAFG
ncbi:hypothetical protein [Streptacidiphilus sp. PB12-B1b]|uniref:hypothetical protein n=1 Tax=Streptacidiphilus sp. PB12-B1b TaxID=2705012 RepID=UPI0015FA66E9|nr:hypothetical protein [Streptacidiphilus sp. PB12-B1b]